MPIKLLLVPRISNVNPISKVPLFTPTPRSINLFLIVNQIKLPEKCRHTSLTWLKLKLKYPASPKSISHSQTRSTQADRTSTPKERQPMIRIILQYCNTCYSSHKQAKKKYSTLQHRTAQLTKVLGKSYHDYSQLGRICLGAHRQQPVEILTRFALIAPDQLNHGEQTKLTVKHHSKQSRIMVIYS